MIEFEKIKKRVEKSSYSEEELIRRVREENDRAAFQQIFSTYYKRLHGYAYSFVKQKQGAEDIVQSIFLNIWAQREDWNPPGTIKHYLFSAVRNKALNVIRHQRIVKEKEDEVTRIFKEIKTETVSKNKRQLEKLRSDIQEGINQLPSKRKEIFLLNRRSGLTYSEIAEFLDISVNTVGTQMTRALKFLRNHLADYLPLIVMVTEFSVALLYV
ncbi:RNA polymerase sigma-70 factor [Fodinibius salsisoli]|uniref:RNA polymerase sigma-70 factor n=1 Tax=Fodinibius salsisoli TaxID=2820877 RepID=A0ABT3PQ40_9BACT|nr:RNA polymerase sigma-70 factor [Fodinibius salsisoli]MCW9707974.1 RNA polymerase sigma-70 factor [Fodinibius salsisoli]